MTLPAGQARTDMAWFRCRPADLDAFRKAAADAGISMSQWLYEAALHKAKRRAK
jgi:uncharacterized protein (DUF1778 family)